MTEPNPDNRTIPPVDRVRHEVDRWLEAVRSTGERAMETLGLTPTNRPSTPPVDVIELPEDILVQIDLPGISAELVELSLVGNTLTVSANRTRPEFSIDAKVHLRERFVGQYQRSIPLPSVVNDEAIRAETRDGLLTVILRKMTPMPGRSIPVTTRDSSAT